MLNFLDKNTSKFFPDLFPDAKKRTSMFNKISSAIFEDGSKKKNELEARMRLVNELKTIKWVPVCTVPPSTFLPWDKEFDGFIASPLASKCMDKMWLVSATYR